MNAQQIIKRLKREVRANPAKAGVLGLLSVVAIYFWAPLVMQWIKPAAKPGVVNAELAAVAVGDPAATTNSVTSTTSAANGAATTTVTKQHWQALVNHLESHPQMKPIGANATGRDPFARGPSSVAKDETTDETTLATAAAATPAQLGLVLNSTVVGPHRRTAIVNGKIYREGRKLRAEGGLEFVVAQVGPRKVVLEREGQQYVLAIAPPTVLNGWELDDGP